MRKTKIWIGFAMLLMTMFCAATFSLPAQAQEIQKPPIEFVERLPDNSVVVMIDGVKHRALNVEHLRALQEQKIVFEAARKENSILTEINFKLGKEIEKLKHDSVLANQQFLAVQTSADKYKKQYEDEKSLRLAAEKLPPKPHVVLQILNHPVVKIGFAAAATYAAAKTSL